MRKLLAIFSALLLAGNALAQTFVNTVGSDDGVAISGFDIVAFYTEKKAMTGSPSLVHSYLGAKWLFSTPETLSAFRTEPEKYIPAWGGQCAWCVSENCVSTKKLSGDFEFLDGKLYLFAYGNNSRNGAKDDFLYGKLSRPMRIRAGEKNWGELKKRLEEGTIVQPTSATYTKTKYE